MKITSSINVIEGIHVGSTLGEVRSIYQINKTIMACFVSHYFGDFNTDFTIKGSILNAVGKNGSVNNAVVYHLNKRW